MKCQVQVHVRYKGTHGRGAALLKKDVDWHGQPQLGQHFELPFNDEHAGTARVMVMVVLTDRLVVSLKKFKLHTPDFCQVDVQEELGEMLDVPPDVDQLSPVALHAFVCSRLEKEDFITALEFIRDNGWDVGLPTWMAFAPVEDLELDDTDAEPPPLPKVPGDPKLN